MLEDLKVLVEINQLMAAVDLSSTDAGEVVAENEKVVGVLSETLKRLYVVLLKGGDRINALIEKHNDRGEELLVEHNGHLPDDFELPDDLNAMRREIELEEIKVSLVKNIFWAAVKVEFPTCLDKDCGIREGDKVVTFDRKLNIRSLLDGAPIDLGAAIVLGSLFGAITGEDDCQCEACQARRAAKAKG